MKLVKLVAVLSSTVINVSGQYDVEVGVEMPDVKDMPSYVGHPDTAQLLAECGVKQMPKGELFNGLQIGESFIAVPLANPNRDTGWTVDQSLSTLDDLRVTSVTRIK
jgi:hypothetical protein